MILLPYAHESMSYRRMPYVTIGILAVCVLLQIIDTAFAPSTEEVVAARQRVLEMFLEHPHLEIPTEEIERIKSAMPEIVGERIDGYRAHAETYREQPGRVSEVLGSGPSEGGGLGDLGALGGEINEYEQNLNDTLERSGGTQGGFRRAMMENMLMPERTELQVFQHLRLLGPDGEQREQDEMDRALAALDELNRASPAMRYGYTPADGLSVGLVTYQFLHGGWLHLIGNLLFLWLVAFNVEDRWGRIFFPAFFLFSGVVAALCHAAMAPPASMLVPLVGASGSISALMGVFLIHFARTKIRVFWLHFFFLVPRWGNFAMPAYLVLPAWLLDQLVSVWLGSDKSVAYWAHIGGFGFGAVAAAALKLTKVEEKHITKGLEEEEVVLEVPDQLPEAQELYAQGRYAEADEKIDPLLRRSPDRIDALEIRIFSRIQLRRPGSAVESLSTGLASLARKGAIEDASTLWRAVKDHLLRDASSIPIETWMRLAHALRSAGFAADSGEEYRSLLRAHGINTQTLPAVIAYSDLIATSGGDRRVAAAVLTRALEMAQGDPLWQQRIETKLKSLEQ